jgi:hypothetical protein
MRGRVFFADFLSCFKKFAPLDNKYQPSTKSRFGLLIQGRNDFCEALNKYLTGFFNSFGQLFKPKVRAGRFCFSKISGQNGQSILEYFIIIVTIMVIVAIGFNTFLFRARQSGQTILNKAIREIAFTENEPSEEPGPITEPEPIIEPEPIPVFEPEETSSSSSTLDMEF